MKSSVILARTLGTFKRIALEEIYALCNTYSVSFGIPLELHLDHYESLDDIRHKVNASVHSSMIDGSYFSFEENNVKLVKSVVDFCHSRDCSVEAEQVRLGGVEDDMSVDAENVFLTDPQKAKHFAKRTGVDSLTVAKKTKSISSIWQKFVNWLMYHCCCTVQTMYTSRICTPHH